MTNKQFILSLTILGIFLILFSMLIPSTNAIMNDEKINTISDNKDCYLSKSGNTYANVRTGTPADTLTNTTNLNVGQTKVGLTYTIYRSFLFFNTSFIPNYAYIINSTLYFVCVCSYTEKTFNVTLQRNITEARPSIPPVVADYYHLFYSGNGGQKTISGAGTFPTYLYFNDTIKTWINKTGFTKFCLRSDRDINSGNQPTGQQYVIIPSSIYPTVNLRPYLNITYYTIALINESINNTIVYNNISFCFMKDNSINFSIQRNSTRPYLMNTSFFLDNDLIYTDYNNSNGTVFFNILSKTNLTIDKQYNISVNCSDGEGNYLNTSYTFTKLTIFSDCNDDYIESAITLEPEMFLLSIWLFFLYIWFKSESWEITALVAVILTPYSVLIGVYMIPIFVTDAVLLPIMQMFPLFVAIIVLGYTVEKYREKRKKK